MNQSDKSAGECEIAGVALLGGEADMFALSDRAGGPQLGQSPDQGGDLGVDVHRRGGKRMRSVPRFTVG
jgi:hypothetical protein